MKKPVANKRMAETGKRVSKRLARNPLVQSTTQNGMTVYAHPGFLTLDECRELLFVIDAHARPSTLYAGTEQEGFRTSSSCDFDRNHPVVQAFDQRVTELLGIDERHGESLQGQRYFIGQVFKAHHDYFHVDQSYWEMERTQGGQRSWTAMAYLNQPESGGETVFTKAGICFAPQVGTLLIWNNMDENGLPNDHAMHEACAVAAGAKYVLTKWYRENFWVGNLPHLVRG